MSRNSSRLFINCSVKSNNKTVSGLPPTSLAFLGALNEEVPVLESISKTIFEAWLVTVQKGLEKEGKSFPALTVIGISK